MYATADNKDSEDDSHAEDASTGDNDTDATDNDRDNVEDEENAEEVVDDDEGNEEGEEDVDDKVANQSIPIFDTYWSFDFQPIDKVHRFPIDAVVGCLATTVRAFDPTAYITSWNNGSTRRIWSTTTVPTTDTAMKNFVEDPHTCWSKWYILRQNPVRASMTLSEIKQNPEFGAWIRAQGLFLDVSEISCIRPTLSGFFYRKLPHSSRIPIFKGYLQATYT